jgi:hypothetical protein
MEDDSSTPIESVMAVENEHADEANAALAELNGVSGGGGGSGGAGGGGIPAYQQMYSGESMEVEEAEESAQEDSLDFWLQLSLTFIAVSVAVFVLFLPKVRQLIEPVIGTGYIALIIRSLVIGIISLLPRLLLM